MSVLEKRLYRTRNERMLNGVCGGLAQYFNMDPTIIRLIVVAITFATGPGMLLAYLILAVIIPEEPAGYIEAQPAEPVEPADFETEVM